MLSGRIIFTPTPLENCVIFSTLPQKVCQNFCGHPDYEEKTFLVNGAQGKVRTTLG